MIKPPPNDLEAERAVIGTILSDEASSMKIIAEIIDIIKPEHFYHADNQKIFNAMVNMFLAGEKISIVTVHDKLVKEDIPAVKLTEMSSYSVFGGCRAEAEIVSAKYQRRQIRTAALKILRAVNDEEINLNEINDLAYEEILNLNNTSLEKTTYTDKELYNLLMGDIIDRADRKIRGLATYIMPLDRHIQGLGKGDYGIIGARPSMGKTALILSMLLNMAIHGKTVHFFSIEMSKEKIYDRIAAYVTGIASNKISSGKLTPEEQVSVSEKLSKLRQCKFIITEKISDLGSIKAAAIKQNSIQKTDFIAIDYLQLMGIQGKKADSDENTRLTTISRQLKLLANQLECPVFALSQLSRNVEGRQNKRPMLSDLRGSGSIEQDADHVWLLYRDEYYNQNTSTPNIIEVNIAKFRNGVAGANINLNYNKALGRFQ